MNPANALQLTGWRREVAALYARVRGEQNPRHAHELWRAGRDALFRSHPQSPLPPGDPLRRTGVPYWPYDPALRWELALQPVSTPARIPFDTGEDGTTVIEQVGVITIPPPAAATVAVWWLGQYAGGLFLPLRDATAGTDTYGGGSYGGGRYLLDAAKSADLGGDDRSIIVDLNFLYHPSCRYDPRWVCPLAPPQNRIAAPIRAGERLT